jgi:hypothetical protein
MPVYCTLDLIHGFESEKELADELFAKHADGRPAMCIFDVSGKHGRPDHIYGQCTFVHNEGKPLKFVDTFESIVRQDVLGLLISRYSVGKVLFTEQATFDRFATHPRVGIYKKRYCLVPVRQLGDEAATVSSDDRGRSAVPGLRPLLPGRWDGVYSQGLVATKFTLEVEPFDGVTFRGRTTEEGRLGDALAQGDVDETRGTLLFVKQYERHDHIIVYRGIHASFGIVQGTWYVGDNHTGRFWMKKADILGEPKQ